MRAITLNLLVEEQRAQEARAKDPIKTAVAIGISVVMVVTLAGSFLSVIAGNIRGRENTLKNEWNAMAAQRDASATTGFKALKSHVDELVAVNRTRSLVAPQLAMIQDVVPDTIHLTRMDIKVVTEQIERRRPTSTKTEAQTAEGRATTPAPSKSNKQTVERLTCRIEGQAVSARPELVVDEFIAALGSDKNLGPLMDNVQLRSIGRIPMRDENNPNLAVAAFVIECQYKLP